MFEKAIRKEMKLSIITINYNNASGLRRTLDSVVAQRLDGAEQAEATLEVEHIIVDGNSTDESVAIIRDYEQHILSLQCGQLGVPSISLTWVSEPDKGIYNAMNKGIEVALGLRQVDAQHRSLYSELEGEYKGTRRFLKENKDEGHYIQILNSGDRLYSASVISEMMKALIENRYPGIMYGNMIRDYGDNVRNKRRNVRDQCLGAQHEWTMYDFIRGTINHDPTWINRTEYEKYGLYDPNLKICSDWKWFVTAVVFGGERPMYVPVDVTLFDVTGISETQLVFREKEREAELRKMLPEAVLKDYWNFHFPINQIQRLKRHHLWPFVYLMERVLFKLEKWGILKG